MLPPPVGSRSKVERKARGALWKVAKRTRATVTTKTKQGTFQVSTRDRRIGYELFVFGEFELKLMHDVFGLLERIGKRPRGTLVDIGANMGITSVGILEAGLMTRSIAIEPAPGNLELLRRNVQLNGLADRISILPVAISDEAGTVAMELSDDNLGDHRVRMNALASGEYSEAKRATVSVPRRRLDDVMDELPPGEVDRIDLAWIDTQGHEGYVFAGGPRFFARGLPTLCEVWPYALERAGTAPNVFCERAAAFWDSYWMERQGGYVRYPIAALGSLIDELAQMGHHFGSTNVVFTKS
jgi:FkbM family methyltransferase